MSEKNSRPRLNSRDVSGWPCNGRTNSFCHAKSFLSTIVNGKYWEQEDYDLKSRNTSFSIDEKYEMLHFAFPDVDSSVVEDVLVAKNYDLADSAQVLSSFTAETGKLVEEYDVIDKTEEDGEKNDEWVVVQDDWELIDDDGTRVPTYSEVVMTPFVSSQTKQFVLSAAPVAAANAFATHQNKRTSHHRHDLYPDEYFEMKNFGQRRINHLQREKAARQSNSIL